MSVLSVSQLKETSHQRAHGTDPLSEAERSYRDKVGEKVDGGGIVTDTSDFLLLHQVTVWCLSELINLFLVRKKAE